MIFPIRFTSAAMARPRRHHVWIAEHDSPAKAGYVLDRIYGNGGGRWPHFLDRGSRPRNCPAGLMWSIGRSSSSLTALIYEVTRSEVVIHLIADGRRDLQALVAAAALQSTDAAMSLIRLPNPHRIFRASCYPEHRHGDPSSIRHSPR